MRRHAKASSAGSTTRQAASRRRVFRGALATCDASCGSDGTGASPTRRFVLAVFSIALVALTFAVVPASATKTHFLLEDFGSAAQPEFSAETRLLAVDQSNGDVLVFDRASKTIRRFKADGTPDDFSALGTNVIDGEGSHSCGTVPADCDETPEGGIEFDFSVRSYQAQIAIDNSGTATDGDIYVTQLQRHLVYVFSSAGAYLGKLAEYKEGAHAGGSATGFGEICGVAAGPDGTVYVGDRGGYVHKYAPSANPPANADNVANFSFSEACNIAVGAGPTAGSIFVVSAEGEYDPESRPLFKVDASTGEVKYLIDYYVNGVYVDPATGEVYTARSAESPDEPGGFGHFDASGGTSATLIAAVPAIYRGAGGSKGIAVRGSTGNVYLAEGGYSRVRVYGPYQTGADLEIRAATELSATRARVQGSINPDGKALTACTFEYGTVESGAFASSVPCEESVSTDTSQHAVSAVITGLTPSTKYHYRLSVTNADRTSTSGAINFLTLPRIFTGGPMTVSPEAATASGYVRPEAEQVTTCAFEYGPTSSYGTSVPCSPPAASIAADYPTQAVSGALSGLEELTIYHYRLTFTTAAGTFTGKDEFFRTLGPSGLPDNRRYERVSPAEKNGGNVETGGSAASLDGNRLVFSSVASFAGAPTHLAVGQQYLAARGAGGWSTKSIVPRGGQIFGNMYQVFNDGLTQGALMWNESQGGQFSPLDPNALPGLNLYLHDLEGGPYTLLNGTYHDVGGSSFHQAYVLGASAGFTHLAIAAHDPLTPDAPHSAHNIFEMFASGGGCNGIGGPETYNGYCAYEWVDGTLRLASILPNGEPVEGMPGGFSNLESTCSSAHAMSADGARLFFTSPPHEPGTQAYYGGEMPKLYAREDGTSTTLISASERTLPGGSSGQPPIFQDAEAAHGNRVLFTTESSLVNADTDETNDLYLYDYTKPAGERLILISEDRDPNAPEGSAVNGGPEHAQLRCGGVVGTSEDLRRVYFVADNQIVAGEPEGIGPKLYLWDDTGASPTVTYIGTLNPGDDRTWQGSPYHPVSSVGSDETRDARTSADGRYLALFSTAQLTGFNNEGKKELYRYDALGGSLECASCSADASPSNGAIGFSLEEEEKAGGVALLPIVNQPPLNITESGQVFFDTTRGLLPADSNGAMDVYEYEQGHARLISLGEGVSGSYFLDATPNGSDVFFITSDPLVGWDRDDNGDAYDARVGGGFPEPALVPPACQGDACQPAPIAPNDPTPASSSFEGSGNVSEPRQSRCAKGKVRRHWRCVKRRRHHKQARHQRTATRSHG